MRTDYGIAYVGDEIIVAVSHLQVPSGDRRHDPADGGVGVGRFSPTGGQVGGLGAAELQQYTQSGCSMASWKGRIWVCFLANDDTNRLLICSAPADLSSRFSSTNLIQSSNQTQSGQSNQAPCLTVFRENLWVAFISNDGNKEILLCQAENDNATTWSDNRAIPNQSSQGSPSLVQFGNDLWLAYVSNDTHNRLLYTTWNGHHWSNDQRVQNPTQTQLSQSTPSLAVFKGNLWIAFISNDTHNAILTCFWNGREWSDCYAVQGQSSGTAPVLVNVNDEELWVAFGSNDGNNVQLYCSSTDGRNWVRAGPEPGLTEWIP
jgi:hypothetical protein